MSKFSAGLVRRFRVEQGLYIATIKCFQSQVWQRRTINLYLGYSN
jgi:hypothetical protein